MRSEANNNGFKIFRSADGTNFTVIANIASQATNGNSTTPLNYSYEDIQPLDGNNYYKPAQVDKDGKLTYDPISLVKRIKLSKIEFTSVYPNPGKSNVRIVLASPSSQKITAAIADIGGRVIKQQNVQANAVDNAIDFNLTSMPAGTYWFKAFCNNGCEATPQKIVSNKNNE